MKKWIKQITEGMILSATTCYMFFIYAPLELLFTNQDEFFFDSYILLPILLVIFFATFIPSVMVFAFLRKKSERIYTISLGLYFVAFLCSYIQGNFLVKGLPPLDGTWIDWGAYPLERLKCIGVWCTVSLIVFAGYKKIGLDLFQKSIKVISSCMGLMLLVTLITLGATNHGFERKTILNTTTKNLFTMSSNQNFIILVLDAVDARAFSEIVKSDSKYSEIFEDFTAYDNTVGAYPFTKSSIPYILTGVWYENEEAFEDYERRAFAQSSLFKSLETEGYQLGLYETELLLDEIGGHRFDNIVTCKRGVNSYITFARWQIQMAGFKYAPFDLKRICFVNPAAFNTLKLSPNGEEQFTENNAVFYGKITDEEIELTQDKCFKFIHIEGGHVPFQYDEDVNIIENGTYEDNLKACLTITGAYLDKLRESGVYDNSAIIVMADHGYENSMRSNPILYVKGVGEKHELVVSDAPISYEDLQGAYAKLLQGAQKDAVFPYREGDVRERRFIWHSQADFMEEYVQKGHATDMDTLEKTGRTYCLK